MRLTALFPAEDYRFHFRFERGDPANFFQWTSEYARLTAERKHWIETTPERCLALLPEGVALLEETAAFAMLSGSHGQENSFLESRVQESGLLTSTATLKRLGCGWEPDFLLLKPEPTGAVRLVAGCVCFPSSWSLEEKIGHPIESIHGVVPGLNAAIGPQIHGFLTKLHPGVAWLRSNWGLTRSPELNQHPSRNLPRLDNSITLEEVWLRVEHQALIALPQSNGVLFGIRLSVHPLGTIRADPELAPRLVRSLQTMPEPMAVYKGLGAAKDKLIQLLQP